MKSKTAYLWRYQSPKDVAAQEQARKLRVVEVAQCRLDKAIALETNCWKCKRPFSPHLITAANYERGLRLCVRCCRRRRFVDKPSHGFRSRVKHEETVARVLDMLTREGHALAVRKQYDRENRVEQIVRSLSK